MWRGAEGCWYQFWVGNKADALSSMMHSLLCFTGCPLSSPVPSLCLCRITHAVVPKAPGEATALTHLVTPHLGVCVVLAQYQETQESISEPLLWAQSRELQLSRTGSLSHLLLPRTPSASSMAQHKPPSSVQPAKHLRERDGPVKGKINTPSVHIHKCQTPFSGRQRCCWPSSQPRVQPRTAPCPAVPGPSADVHHLLQERGFHAACAELIHPERSLVLQRGAPGVEGEVHVVVQQAADGCHVDIRESHQPSRKVGGVVEGAEDASKLGVEQVLRQ